MVGDSVEFLAGNGLRVLFDAEHFFDGFKRNPEFSLRVLEAAVEKGASHLVLCDTNGGSLPFEVEEIVGVVVSHFRDDATIAIHTHDDTGCAVANAVAAVRAGARQVQGTMNGLGERTGNCNLTTVVPNLSLKMGFRTLPEGRLARLTAVSHHIAELVNRPLNPQAPVRGLVGVRPQGRAARVGHRQAQGRLRARRPGARWATAPASSSARWRARRRSS